MAKKIICYDLELTMPDYLNQFEPEIIELGWSLYDFKTGVIEGPFSQFVRPKKSWLTKNLELFNGISKDSFKGAVTVEQTIPFLRNKGFMSGTAVSYGNDFEAICKTYPDPDQRPFPNSLDLAQIFRIIERGQLVSLEKLLLKYGLEFEGFPHRAGPDSYNLARLLRCLTLDGKNDKEHQNA